MSSCALSRISMPCLDSPSHKTLSGMVGACPCHLHSVNLSHRKIYYVYWNLMHGLGRERGVTLTTMPSTRTWQHVKGHEKEETPSALEVTCLTQQGANRTTNAFNDLSGHGRTQVIVREQRFKTILSGNGFERLAMQSPLLSLLGHDMGGCKTYGVKKTHPPEYFWTPPKELLICSVVDSLQEKTGQWHLRGWKTYQTKGFQNPLLGGVSFVRFSSPLFFPPPRPLTLCRAREGTRTIKPALEIFWAISLCASTVFVHFLHHVCASCGDVGA